jgi:hypothetical protein
MVMHSPGADPPDRAYPSCDINLFGRALCGSFPGTLKLLVSNPWNLSADAYREPDFQAYLETMGLGNIQSAGEKLVPLNPD